MDCSRGNSSDCFVAFNTTVFRFFRYSDQSGQEKAKVGKILRVERRISEKNFEGIKHPGGIKKKAASDKVEFIDENGPAAKLAKLNSAQNSLSSIEAKKTGTDDLLRFHLERRGSVADVALFDTALKSFQAACDRHPYKQGSKYIPNAVLEARDKFLRAADSHLKAMGIKVVNTGETLQLKADPTTKLGRFAARAQKHGNANVQFHPLMSWVRKNTDAAFNPDSRTIRISLDGLRAGKAGKGEYHEFIHAVVEHYCGDLGGNSALYGDVQAEQGSDLFPGYPCAYNRRFGLDETVTYAYEMWWAGRDLKRLCDILEGGEVQNDRSFIADLKSCFQELPNMGLEIAEKSVEVSAAIASLLDSLFHDSKHPEPKLSFSRTGKSTAHIACTKPGLPLGLDFRLASTRAGHQVLWARCRNPPKHNSLEIQVTDPIALQKVSEAFNKAPPEEAARTLSALTRDFVLPRINASKRALVDVNEAYLGVLSAYQTAGAVISEISPAALSNSEYRAQLLEALNSLFTATRTLRKIVGEHAKA